MSEAESELSKVGRKRSRLQARIQDTEAELRRLVVDADGEIPRLRIAQLAGLSRQTIYTWLGKS